MDPFEQSTECLGGLGARGEATAPGQGKNRQRLIPGTTTVCEPDADIVPRARLWLPHDPQHQGWREGGRNPLGMEELLTSPFPLLYFAALISQGRHHVLPFAQKVSDPTQELLHRLGSL